MNDLYRFIATFVWHMTNPAKKNQEPFGLGLQNTMSFEDELALLNELYFFREFTFSKMTFRPVPSQEAEFADSIIWIGDILAVFQIKQREANRGTTAEAEKRWFESKVLKLATRQVRGTLKYLKDLGSIEIRNHRGHAFNLDLQSIHNLYKLIVYLPYEALPEKCRMLKHHRSSTAGVIHIISANDYLGIVRTLLTPAEVADYLNFREELIERWEGKIADVPESALVGQYLNGDSNVQPSIEFLEYLQHLDHRLDEWDISELISTFPDVVTTNNEPTDYYPIIRELALLKRNELREFKKRFQLSVKKARSTESVRPYIIAFPRTNCGFVFIPVIKENLPHRKNGLRNFTFAYKYASKLPKCIGVSIPDDTDGMIAVEWFYAEFPWEQDAELEQMLQDDYPFRDVRQNELPRYTYRDAK